MAKNDVKQLNYTVDQINSGLENAFNVGSEKNGLTLKHIDEKTLQIFNTHGSDDENDWTPVGDGVLMINADPDAKTYKFDFTPISSTEPQTFVKETVDADIKNEQWKIKYNIKQLDNKGDVQYDSVNITWTIKLGSNTRVFKETINYTLSNLNEARSFSWIEAIYKDTNFYEAGDYTIQARFSGIDNLSLTKTWYFSLASLEFASNFSEEKIYEEEQVEIPYTVTGDMSKTVSCTITNKATGEQTILTPAVHNSSTNQQSGSFIVKNLKHGVYSVLLGCVGVSGTVTVKASDIYKEFIFVESGNNTPLIRWSYQESSRLQQYVRTAFNYGVYVPENTVSTTTIELFSENNQTTQKRSIVPNNSTYTWYYYPVADSTIDGRLQEQIFSIGTLGLESNIKVSKNLIVESFPDANKIEVIDGVSFDFNPTGRTNYDENRDEYVFKGKNYLAPSENFDWANGGWVQENIGTNKNPQIVDAFLIKAGSYITLDYNLFEAAKTGNNINNETIKNGKNIKFIFKSTNCQNMSSTIMDCKGENNTGLIINSQNAKIFYREDGLEAAIDLPYVEEEIVELEYNIEKETYGRKPLLVSYLSSDPSQAVACELTADGMPGQWTQDKQEKIVIGSEFCDVYLYRIKVYNRELSDAEIMQNYYADSFDGNIAYKKYLDNNILQKNGEITEDALKGYTEDVQKLTDKKIKEVDATADEKEKDIMSI